MDILFVFNVFFSYKIQGIFGYRIVFFKIDSFSFLSHFPCALSCETHVVHQLNMQTNYTSYRPKGEYSKIMPKIIMEYASELTNEGKLARKALKTILGIK